MNTANRDVLELTEGHAGGGSKPLRWSYAFENIHGHETTIEFSAANKDDALQLLEDLKAALREKPEIALDADTHNR